jgi:hypothetical protein
MVIVTPERAARLLLAVTMPISVWVAGGGGATGSAGIETVVVAEPVFPLSSVKVTAICVFVA